MTHASTAPKSGLRVLVTGGTGFIGRPLVKRLLQEGHEVVVLSRSPGATIAGAKTALSSQEEPVPAEHLPWAEAVVHLASEPLSGGRWTRARKLRIAESRIHATDRLARALLTAPNLKVFVNASGVGIYGGNGEGQPDEHSPRASGFIAEVTAGREQAAELLCSRGVRVTHLRIGIVLHRGGGYLAKLTKLRRLGLSGQFGDGGQGFSWVHRLDVVELAAAALVNPELTGPVNVTAPEPATNAEFVRALNGLTGQRGVRLPATVTQLLLGDLGRSLLEGRKVAPSRALAAGYRFRYPRLRDALEADGAE